MQINRKFKVTQYHPKGDQSQAINKLVDGLKNRETHQVLLGVTGSGKTYTMAHVIQKTLRPGEKIQIIPSKLVSRKTKTQSARQRLSAKG